MQFNLSGQYNSRRFPDFPNLPGNAIMRVDGQLGVEGEGWSLMLFGRNLLNDDGAVRQRFVTTLAPGVQEIVAERRQPRTIGLRLTQETGQP
jgi:hypothetical protein